MKFRGKLDIMLLSEIKLDGTFTSAEFKMEGYHTPYRRDRNRFGGGLMLFVNNDIVCEHLKTPLLPDDVEAIFIETSYSSC